jgi:hypothetical protein
MKRVIVAASIAVFSASALAENGLPFEQSQFDRGIYNEQSASAGNSRAQDSVWANDHNFIAPAQ